MNSREHPCPDCRYPRRMDEDFCPTCPFLKPQQDQNKSAFSFLFDWGGDAQKKQPEKPVYQEPPPSSPPPVMEKTNYPQYQEPPVSPVYPQKQVPPPPPPEPPRLTKNPPKGTFNPYLQQEVETPKFRLTSVPRHNEVNSNTVEFEGESVILNRNTLDRENYTISGQEHAVVENINGRWYINNRSSLKTTYIQVNSPTEIKEGDVILLGDRMFIFRPE